MDRPYVTETSDMVCGSCAGEEEGEVEREGKLEDTEEKEEMKERYLCERASGVRRKEEKKKKRNNKNKKRNLQPTDGWSDCVKLSAPPLPLFFLSQIPVSGG